MEDDIYMVMHSNWSGTSSVWANSKTESYETARKSNDGDWFIVKYTNFFQVPEEFQVLSMFSQIGIKAFIDNNADNWHPQEFI